MTLEIQSVDTGTVPIAEIKRDEKGLNCRANGVVKSVVSEYAALMRAGLTAFPPVTIFRDSKGALWLADGYHRCAAAEIAGLTEIAADVREGSRKDAILFSVGANASHGLKRTNADRRKAALVLLEDPAWCKRSDNWIAKQANVSQPFVSKLRATSNVISDPVREAADGRTVDTSEIGKGGEASGSDAVVGRLSRALARVISQWPTERRSELKAVLASAVEGSAT